jgi:hypothetical protein
MQRWVELLALSPDHDCCSLPNESRVRNDIASFRRNRGLRADAGPGPAVSCHAEDRRKFCVRQAEQFG